MSEDKIKIVIPLKVPSLNEQLRSHWAQRRAEKQVWAKLMLPNKSRIGSRVFKLVHICGVRPKRQLDMDNFIGGCKEVVVDNLKDFGWIVNDDLRSVSIHYAQEIGKPARTVIELW